MLDLEIKPDEKPTDFTVKNSVHAMSVLSKSLYSDSIVAIVRELSCNAIDSHVANGNPEDKFNIYVDSERFEIRDYGTGLAPLELEKIYTTYFESTKTGSEEFIGSFGLGSKSPFAYTDEFFVATYYFGTLTTYKAEKNLNKLTLTKVSAEHTKESNGLLVYFNLKKLGDYHEFCAAFYKVLPFMEGKFTCPFYIPELKYKVKFENCFVIEDYEGLYDNYVLQNNVVYRLDLSKLSSDIVEKIPKKGVHFVAPNLSLSIAPSREELHYDPQTVFVLEDIITKAIKEVDTYKIDFINTYDVFELRSEKIYELKRQLGPLLNKVIKKDEIYNGNTISYPIRHSNDYYYEVRYKFIRKYGSKIEEYSKDDITYIILNDYRIVYNDTSDLDLGMRKAKYLLKNTEVNSLIYLENLETFNQFCQELALPECFIESKITKVSSIKSLRKKREAKEALDTFIGYYGNGVPFTIHDTTNITAYFVTNYNNPVINGITLDKDRRYDFFSFLESIGINACGVANKDIKLVDPNWELVDNLITKKHGDLFNELINKFYYRSYEKVERFKFLANIPGEKVINNIISNYDSAKNSELIKKFNIYYTYQFYLPVGKFISLGNNVVDLQDILYKAYPMLQFVSLYEIDENTSIISNYVQSVIERCVEDDQSRDQRTEQSNSSAVEGFNHAC